MKNIRTRKDQLHYFVDLLYKGNPELPKAVRSKIRKFGRDCMMCGAIEERQHVLEIVEDEPTKKQIAKTGVLRVLGFED